MDDKNKMQQIKIDKNLNSTIYCLKNKNAKQLSFVLINKRSILLTNT